MPDGSKPAIVHFEITAESFRASAAAIAGADTVRIVDRRTGAVIVDSRHRQRLHTPLGAPDDHGFRSLRDQRADAGVTTIADRRVAFRTVARTPHNANDWIVTVSSPHPMASWLGSLGPGPIGMAAAALLLLAVAGLTFRSSQRELRVAATTDSLTGLPNRRCLFQDLDEAASRGSVAQPRLLALFDLDGFKAYNDAFGHPAGDALLARLATKLRAAVAPWGQAYRLGGDEFCVLASVVPDQALAVVEEAGTALSEQGEGFHIRASHGAALLPIEVDDGPKALHLADERMYAAKAGGRPTADDQSAAVLLRALHERYPDLEGHSRDVANLAEPVAAELDLDAPDRQRLRQVAHLHDIGKVAIPESILDKPGPLDDKEWEFVRRHTLIGERILNAAPALAPAAAPVRSSHERWEGDGYPDGLVGEEIPLVSRIVSVCDAFQAMTSVRPYSQPKTPAAALAELRRCAGTQFDPRVVEAFCDVQARATAAEPAAT
jgi:diguanylate cyclase (GGDEF)-like protein